MRKFSYRVNGRGHGGHGGKHRDDEGRGCGNMDWGGAFIVCTMGAKVIIQNAHERASLGMRLEYHV